MLASILDAIPYKPLWFIVIAAIIACYIFNVRAVTVPVTMLLRGIAWSCAFLFIHLKKIFAQLFNFALSAGKTGYVRRTATAMQNRATKIGDGLAALEKRNTGMLVLTQRLNEALPTDAPEKAGIETQCEYCLSIQNKIHIYKEKNAAGNARLNPESIALVKKNSEETQAFIQTVSYQFDILKIEELLRKHSPEKARIRGILGMAAVENIDMADDRGWTYSVSLPGGEKMSCTLTLKSDLNARKIEIKAKCGKYRLTTLEGAPLAGANAALSFDSAGFLELRNEVNFEKFDVYDAAEYFSCMKNLLAKKELNPLAARMQTDANGVLGLGREDALSLLNNTEICPGGEIPPPPPEQMSDAEKMHGGRQRWAHLSEMSGRGMISGNGFLIGRAGYGSYIYTGDYNSNIVTIAATRSGKGVGVVIPNLLRHRGSVVVLDPKGENYFVTAPKREAMGNKVYYMDPWNRVRASGRDIVKFDGIGQESPDAKKIGDIVSGLLDRGIYIEPEKRERLVRFLSGLFYYTAATFAESDSRRAVGHVIDMARLPAARLEEALDKTEAESAGAPAFQTDFWKQFRALLSGLEQNGEYSGVSASARSSLARTGQKAIINPLDIIEQKDNDIVSKTNMIASSLVMRPPDNNNAFFYDGAEMLIGNLISYICVKYPKGHEKRTLMTLRELLTMDKKELVALLEASAGLNRGIDELKTWLKSVLQTNSKSANDVYQFALNATLFLNDEAMRATLGKSNFDILSMKASPLSLYLVLPVDKLNLNESIYKPFIRMIVTITILAATRSAGTKELAATHGGGSGSDRVLFMLDEIAQLGTLKYLPKLLSICLGMKFNVWTIWQDLGQIKSIYKDDWLTIMGNSTVQQFFGINETDTAEYLSTMAGQTTIYEESISDSEAATSSVSDTKGSSESLTRGTSSTKGASTNMSLPFLGSTLSSGSSDSTGQNESAGESHNASTSVQSGRSLSRGRNRTKKVVPLLSVADAMGGHGIDTQFISCRGKMQHVILCGKIKYYSDKDFHKEHAANLAMN